MLPSKTKSLPLYATASFANSAGGLSGTTGAALALGAPGRAGAAVARGIEAEDGLLLFEEFNDWIEPLSRWRLGDDHSGERSSTQEREHDTIAHEHLLPNP